MSSLNKTSLLSNRMKLVVHPRKLLKFPKIHVTFYMRYASVVFKTLRRHPFQRFLHWILKKENIDEYMVSSVRIMTFPFQKDNGNVLAGRCNSKGEIRIYPKKLEFCRKLKQKSGKEKLHAYIKSRARAALIHELLHVKYSDDEETVRELTRKYFHIFTRHQNIQNPDGTEISKMLFRH